MSELIERLADCIEIHCAGPYNALTTLSLGGHGFMGHEGNLAPTIAADVIAAFATPKGLTCFSEHPAGLRLQHMRAV